MHPALAGIHVEHGAVGSVHGLGLSDYVAVLRNDDARARFKAANCRAVVLIVGGDAGTAEFDARIVNRLMKREVLISLGLRGVSELTTSERNSSWC
jgi:hypothetical protein